MTFYIDGMMIPFRSIVEITDFLLHLSRKQLYQFIDRHVYCSNNDLVWMHCAVIQLSHIFVDKSLCVCVRLVNACDRASYSCIPINKGLACMFVRISTGQPRSPKKSNK